MQWVCDWNWKLWFVTQQAASMKALLTKSKFRFRQVVNNIFVDQTTQMIFVFHCIICLWTSSKEIGEGSLLPNYTTTKKSWSSHSQLSENQTTRSNIKILKINQTFWQIIVVLKKSQHCQSFWFQTVPSANNFASSWFNISLCKLDSPDTSKGSLCAAMPASEQLALLVCRPIVATWSLWLLFDFCSDRHSDDREA